MALDKYLIPRKVKRKKRQCYRCKKIFDEEDMDMYRGEWYCQECEKEMHEEEKEGESR